MKFNFLKKEFFEKYKDCEEMEKKPNRPYACTTLVNCMGVTFAVPLRSHIRHEYAVFTDKEKTKGLDLTKAVVVDNIPKYIDLETKVYIKDEEHKFLKGKEDFLVKKLENYIKQYKKALETPENIKNQRLIKFSALQYFHKELNIELGQEKPLEEVKDQEIPQEKPLEEVKDQEILQEKPLEEATKDDPWKKKLENDKAKGLSLGR